MTDSRDSRYAPQPLARWFMPAAVVSLILMALGSAGIVMHLMTDPARLPLDQRALYDGEPRWVFVSSAVAFGLGLLGTLLLVGRRKVAELFLLLALLAFATWFAGMLGVERMRELLSTDQIAALIAVLAIAWTIYWFARHSRQRGWLR